jgi:hypothetical protein
MNIFVDLFEAFIKCSTKCWLRASGEPTSGNAYAEWVKAQNKFYRDDAAKRLMADVPANECEVAPVTENLKSAKWRLAVDVQVCRLSQRECRRMLVLEASCRKRIPMSIPVLRRKVKCR